MKLHAADMAQSVDEIFASQHNVATREQLRAVLSAHTIDGMVRHGRLTARHRAVYHRAGVALCSRGEAMAALLRCPDGAALTGPLVLGLLGVAGFSENDPFDVLLPPGERVRGVSFRARPNPSVAPTRKLGLLTLVAPARALIDAARPQFGVDDQRLWTGYDSARWHNLVTTARFLRELANSSRRDPGAVRWRRIGDDRLLQLESPKERTLDEVLRRFDPAPEVQVWVTPGRRADFFWRRVRLVIEYLGEGGHGHGDGRQQDQERAAELERVGVRIVPVTKGDLADPAALAAWLLTVARDRAAELGVDPPILRP